MNVPRVIDANANRAREAMRVLEDAARFVLDDKPLTAGLKRLRHDLASVMRMMPGIERSRDTPRDVGTRLSTAAEKSRAGVADVAIAAGKRLSEALRSLEEFGKLIDPRFAARVEQLRYRGYTLEKRLHERLASLAFGGWKLCVIVTESLCTHHSWLQVAQASVDAGADCIQLREKHLEAGEWLRRAERLVKLIHASGGTVVINDRPDIALLSGADGVHVGEFDLPPRKVREMGAGRLVIGASTHNLREAAAAASAGVDYCGVGAIFPTTTKHRTPSGLKYVSRFVAKHPKMHHLAIGGITPANVGQVVRAGARGVAVSSVVCGAKDPAKVVRQLLRAIPRRD